MNPEPADTIMGSFTGLATITFAHPGMLAGLAAVAVPIVIHLIHRGRPVAVVFPTLRFLRASSASRSRLQRLRHLILMLLRCAVVAFVALAFARPHWFASADAAAKADRDTVAVVLLDASASMGYTGAATSTMSQAVTQAAAVIDSLEPGKGDRANVILVGLSPRAMYAKPTSNVPGIKAQLEQARATAERADFSAALVLAAAQFAEFRSSRKEMHVISDFQRTNWSGADLTALPGDVEVTLHRIGPDALRPNACVTDIVIDPPTPMAGEPCRISVRLANYSTTPARRDVTLRANDGREWKQPGVALTPAAPVSVPFDVRFDAPGVYELTAEITPDALAIDDRRYAVMHVSARQRVLLCTDADLREGVTSGYLLARGLAPFPDERGTVELRTARSAELSTALLADADVLFLDASGPLSADGVRAIDEFLRRGGGVAAFLGFGAAAENLAALQSLAAGRSLLPFEVTAIRSEAARLVVNPSRLHPLLQPLGDAGMESLQRVNVYRHFGTRPARKVGQTIATFENDDVALAAVPVGEGTLLVCNVSPEPQWSDLAKHAVFPGLLHQMVSFLRPRLWVVPAACVGTASTQRWHAGEATQGIEIIDTSGEPIHAAIRREGPTAVVTLPPAAAPGFQRIRAGARPLESVAVNVDARESDLAGIPADSIRRRTAGPGRMTGGSTADVEGMKAERYGRPLWPWAMGMGLGALAIEMVFLLFWRREFGGPSGPGNPSCSGQTPGPQWPPVSERRASEGSQ